MNFRFTFITVLFLAVFSLSALAQAPQGINYQAVARNSSGSVVLNQSFNVKATVISGTPTGTAQWEETHAVTTNQFGLFNIVIGQGNRTGGSQTNFSDIDWASGNYYLKIETDLSGTFEDMGTTQLVSVPYALLANKVVTQPSLNDLTDVSTAGASNGQVLKYNGTSWVPANDNTGSGGSTYTAGTGINISGSNVISTVNLGGDVTGTLPSATVTKIQGMAVASTTPSNGQVLKYNSANSQWQPSADNNASYTAGTGISISGNTITNTLPDQTVSLTAGSGVSVTGSYPNFTITNTSSGGGTLNQAYNYGGAGAGKSITANSGPVQITLPNGDGTLAGGIGLQADIKNGQGNAISSYNESAANNYPTIEAGTNSTVTTNAAILGSSTGAASGVLGQVVSSSTAFTAVKGVNGRTDGGVGVTGIGFNGVYGETDYRDGYGVYGLNNDLTGPLTSNAIGVYGGGFNGVVGQTTDPSNGFGVYAIGDLGASGTKSFQIDHPLDPANKYLKHFSIESDEVLNVYRGNVILDANGQATVTLPAYFSAININFSYNLTAVGSSEPNLYVKDEVNGNQFSVAGGKPGAKVSWTLFAERNDLYMQKTPGARDTEIQKLGGDAGKYQMPELYGQPKEKGIFYKELPTVNSEMHIQSPALNRNQEK